VEAMKNRPLLVQSTILFLVYFGVARLGLQIGAVNRFATLVWPPTGIAIAALLIFGKHLWPAIALGALLVNWSLGATLVTAVGISVGNTLEAILAVSLLSCVGFERSFRKVRDVFVYVFGGALVPTLVSATLGVGSLWLSGVLPKQEIARTWSSWWLGDVAGALVIGALILAWANPVKGRATSRLRVIEIVALIGLVAIGSLLLFTDLIVSRISATSTVYYIFPIFTLTAVRLGQRGTTAAIALLSGVLLYAAAFDHLVPWRGELSHALFQIQIFICILSASKLVLAAAISERALETDQKQKDYLALKQLLDLTNKLVSQENLTRLLEQIIDAAIALTNADKGNIQLFDEEKKVLRLLAHRGLSEDFVEIFAEIGEEGSSCFEAARLCKRVIVEDVSKSAIFLKSPENIGILKAAGIGAVMSTPLISQEGKLLGVFSTHWREPHLSDERTLQMLDLLAREAAHLIEHRQREGALKKAKDVAEAANRSKDLFLATISHELRTPLSSILGWAQIIKGDETGDRDRMRRGIESIERSSLAQNRLIGDLLDVSRIIVGKLQVQKTQMDLLHVLLKAVDAIRPEAKKKSIAIVENFNLTPLYALADAARMMQVFLNLLSNSIKFTPDGGRIEIGIQTNDAASPPRVQIQIRDTGNGISSVFLPFVFERFSQADASSTRANGGLGLGLSLARNLVEMHGGTIRAESEGENKGATFTITLPLVAQLPKNVSAEMESEESSLMGVKVLFVDDDLSMCELMTEALPSFGAEVRVACSAKAALLVFQEFKPDVIVSDIGMPIEDGYALIDKIRDLEDRHDQATPAIVLSANAGPESRWKALKAGFQDHLSKPVDLSVLARTIAKWSRPRLRSRQVDWAVE